MGETLPMFPGLEALRQAVEKHREPGGLFWELQRRQDEWSTARRFLLRTFGWELEQHGPRRWSARVRGNGLTPPVVASSPAELFRLVRETSEFRS